uniref:RNA-directed RNA polymerase n=1 Tax=Acinopterus angulatus reovirus TaxID=1141931 RepID=H6V5B7_9REOV|nr:RNA-directed RNA polymerase [Acinopterus angulatus reovirus]
MFHTEWIVKHLIGGIYDGESLREIQKCVGRRDNILLQIQDGAVLEPGKPIQVSGKSRCGLELEITLELPLWVTLPPSQIPGALVYSDTEAGFTETSWQYIPTFNAGKFLREVSTIKDEELSVRDKVLKRLLEKSGYQARVGSIWREVLTVVVAVTALYSKNHLILKYIRGLLWGYQSVPFYEKEGKVIWETEMNSLSILPLLLLGACNLGTMVIAGVLEEIDCGICIHHWLTCAIEKFQDTKLDTQKACTNWLPEALDRLGIQRIPAWGIGGILIGTKLKDLSEPQVVRESFQAARERRELKLSGVLFRIVERMITLRNLESVKDAYQVMRMVSNDGTYFVSLSELTIDAAVLPKTPEGILGTLKPLYTLGSNQILHYDLSSVPEFLPTFRYLSRAVPRWSNEVREMNMTQEILPFLTTSSAGKQQVEIKTRPEYSPKINQLFRKRIGAYTIQQEELNNRTKFRAGLSAITTAVKREQIRRRQRAVAGVNNERLLGSLPALRVYEVFQKILGHASSGKQQGHLGDISLNLFWSSEDNVVLNGLDVAGFDASVQMVSQTAFLDFASQSIGAYLPDAYLSYSTGMVEVTDSEGKKERRVVTAFQALISDIMTYFQPQSTRVRGDVIPYLTTKDPTFPSGLAYTTVHHTIRLIGGIMGAICGQMQERPNPRISTLQSLRVQGDDMFLAYYGSDDEILKDLKFDVRSVAKLGFEAEGEASRSTAEFLQQRVCAGTPLFYCDRVSLFTAEKPRESKGPIDRMSEILALIFDIGNRVPNPDGLIHLAYAIYLICCSRNVIKISKKLAKELVSTELGKRLRCVDLSEGNENDFHFVEFMLPLSYGWAENGPMLPPLAYLRGDGTLSPVPSYYTLRGDVARRTLFDLSLSDVDIPILNEWDIDGKLTNPIDFLDEKILRETDIDLAYIIMDYINGIFSDLDFESDLALEAEIDVLAQRIKTTQNQKRIGESMAAYNKLKECGIGIPKTIVAAYEAETKLYGGLKSLRKLGTEEVRNSDIQVERMIKRWRNCKEGLGWIDSRKSDLMLLSRCWWGDQFIEPSNAWKINQEVNLSLEVRPGTSGDKMLAYVDLRNPHSTYGDAFVRGVQRTFKDSIKGDHVMDLARKIKREHPTRLRLFMKAAGIEGKAAIKMAQMLRDEQWTDGVYFRTIYSPRQYFMLSPDPNGLVKHIDCDRELDGYERAYKNVFCQQWLSSNIREAEGKRIQVWIPRRRPSGPKRSAMR